tara:strand:- start:288 stop:890 length:603 start_codon:yes stop_codon:yes gene_type:complete
LARFVYLISPKRLNNNFYIELSKVLKSKKVKYFQLRLKGQKNKYVLNILKKVKKITKKYRVKLILNDNPYLALKSNVDGCHIGQLDTKVSIARKILKKKILGVTCHNSLNLIRKAENFNADYIGVGSFFKSKLKPKAKKAKIIDLKKIRDKTKLPIVAIGGVNQKNYKKLLNSGANYIAISSFIWNNPILNPSDAIKRIK